MSSVFARMLANVLVAGSGVLIRAVTQAYRQAVINGKAAGVGTPGAAATRAGAKKMSVDEARLILGIEKSATREEILARYQKMFDANGKIGTFYIQSKVHRAMERLDEDIPKAEGGAGGDAGAAGDQQQQQQR